MSRTDRFAPLLSSPCPFISRERSSGAPLAFFCKRRDARVRVLRRPQVQECSIFLLLLLAVAALLSSSSAAFALPKPNEIVEISSLKLDHPLAPGKTSHLLIEATIMPGWHVNSNHPLRRTTSPRRASATARLDNCGSGSIKSGGSNSNLRRRQIVGFLRVQMISAADRVRRLQTGARAGVDGHLRLPGRGNCNVCDQIGRSTVSLDSLQSTASTDTGQRRHIATTGAATNGDDHSAPWTGLQIRMAARFWWCYWAVSPLI